MIKYTGELKEDKPYNTINKLEIPNYYKNIDEDMGEAYLIRAELYQELNEIDKAEADRFTAQSKSKILEMLLEKI